MGRLLFSFLVACAALGGFTSDAAARVTRNIFPWQWQLTTVGHPLGPYLCYYHTTRRRFNPLPQSLTSIGRLQTTLQLHQTSNPSHLNGPCRTNSNDLVNGFSWANCDGESLPGKIQSLAVHPDPISIPGDLTISTVLSTKVSVESPLKIAITAEKEIMGEWIKVPCIDNLGSCTYDDACDILDALIQPGQECPEPLRTYGLPCHCPFKAGSYSLPDTSIKIPNISLPSWLASGNYRVTGVMSHESEEIGCATFTFSLQSSESWWW